MEDPTPYFRQIAEPQHGPPAEDMIIRLIGYLVGLGDPYLASIPD